MSHKLSPDAQVPALKLPLVGGGTFDISEENPKNFTMILFYRGLHCPVCANYIGGLAKMLEDFEAQGFSVVVASMNTEELAAKAAEEWNLGKLRVAYDVTIEDAKNWGLWVSKAFKDVEADFFTEPGLFWVRPDGRLYLVDISNMPWARPDLGNLLSKVNYALENDYPARGTFEG
ncbi:redoxin domain-containing protein [Alphaproteobacteria bacterium KMM 3653]|uniref:Redoxin domain-containing protein n=1 Tax=Harenicola maris TaxID=2841044 RepID=A0AAP2CMP7_9RHOB|nr:redoxin domain-containing protein [Harenicola maris]